LAVLFEIATTMVRPFFTEYAAAEGYGTAAAAALFLLPNLAALAVLPLAEAAYRTLGAALLPVAFVLAGAGLAWQALDATPIALIGGRVLFGIGLGMGQLAVDIRMFEVAGTAGPAYSAVQTARIGAQLITPVLASSAAEVISGRNRAYRLGTSSAIATDLWALGAGLAGIACSCGRCAGIAEGEAMNVPEPTIRLHVDPANPGQHILDEALMAGHIDNTHLTTGRQIEPGKAEIYRQLPLLLFGKAVRIDTGQRLNQRRFAVVDMPGRANDVGRSLGPGGGFLRGNSLPPVA
jgi:hypothetical protein